MTIQQFVNLTKNIALLDSDIKSEDRCGSLSVDLTAEKADSSVLYKAKITAVGNKNVIYSRKEMKRNDNFKIKRGIVGVIDEKKIRISGINLPAAGGNKYKIEAKDSAGNIVSTAVEVETIRKLYYQAISMKSGSHPSKFDEFTKEFQKHHIIMEEKGSGKNKMEFIKTIHNTNREHFYNEARKVFSIRSFKPYAVAVIFSNMVAKYKENTNIDHYDVSISSKVSSAFKKSNPEIIINLKDAYNNDAYLWKDLDETHDKADKFWLISAYFITSAGKRLKISNSKVEIDGKCEFDEGGYNKLKITLDEEHLKNVFTTNKGSVEVKTLVVSGFSGGFSTGDTNVITIAMKAWWKKAPDPLEETMQVMNHEMGHKIGMSATGDRPLPASASHYSFIDVLTPDSGSNLYGEYYEGPNENNFGHQGPHCKKGVIYNAANNTWSGGSPGCVMFGATSMTDTDDNKDKATPPSFCAECGKIVRKLDVDGNNRMQLKNVF